MRRTAETLVPPALRMKRPMNSADVSALPGSQAPIAVEHDEVIAQRVDAVGTSAGAHRPSPASAAPAFRRLASSIDLAASDPRESPGRCGPAS